VLEPGLRFGKLATIRLGYGTANSISKLCLNDELNKIIIIITSMD
jgi:hypothetical protein